MAPSAIQPQHDRPSCISHISLNHPKTAAHTTTGLDEEASAIPPHPLDVKPTGNAYTAAHNLRNTSGGLFAALADELVIQILELLDGSSLFRIGATCKVLYAFATADDFWKPLFLE
jgi:F-box-like